MQDDLSPQLKQFLINLRQEPLFHQVLREYPRTRLRTWKRHSESEAQEKTWIHASGIVEGEKSLMIWLLGMDNSRETEND
jgi:hypothetical protein